MVMKYILYKYYFYKKVYKDQNTMFCMEIEINVKGYECERCSHQWMPRIKDKIPIICPLCHSPYWNKARRKK